MSLAQWIDFCEVADARGALVAIEGESTIPFEIKRVYYLYGTKPDISRGFHAHRELVQVAVCVAGSCRMVLDDGALREEVNLHRPDEGLVIREMIWHEMLEFSSDCVLLVLASAHYDEGDYVRDYGTFTLLTGRSKVAGK